MATRKSRKPAPDTRESEGAKASGASPDAGEGEAPTHAADSAPAIEARPDAEAPAEAPTETPAAAPAETPIETLAPEPQDVVTATLETAAPTLTGLRVTAKHDGFRRCGRAWPASGVEVSADDFTDAEIERLVAEPELVVVPVFGPAREIE